MITISCFSPSLLSHLPLHEESQPHRPAITENSNSTLPSPPWWTKHVWNCEPKYNLATFNGFIMYSVTKGTEVSNKLPKQRSWFEAERWIINLAIVLFVFLIRPWSLFIRWLRTRKTKYQFYMQNILLLYKKKSSMHITHTHTTPQTTCHMSHMHIYIHICQLCSNQDTHLWLFPPYFYDSYRKP